MVFHLPSPGCVPPKRWGVCLTSASKEISGTKNMMKSNMSLKAFLDQGRNNQLISPQGTLHWGDSWLFFSDEPLSAHFLPIYYHLQVKQKTLLNPHSKEKSELEISQETNSTYCSGASGKAEVSFRLFWRQRKKSIPISFKPLQSLHRPHHFEVTHHILTLQQPAVPWQATMCGGFLRFRSHMLWTVK